MVGVRQLLKQKGTAAYTISPRATVLDALREMAEHDVGALVVVEAGEVRGVVSERDYARKVILRGKASADTSVSDIMSDVVVSVTSKESIDGCMAQMTDKRVRHLPVIEDGLLMGIISIGDVVKAIIESQKHEIEELEGYITGSR